jgi:hypothetical protein
MKFRGERCVNDLYDIDRIICYHGGVYENEIKKSLKTFN